MTSPSPEQEQNHTKNNENQNKVDEVVISASCGATPDQTRIKQFVFAGATADYAASTILILDSKFENYQNFGIIYLLQHFTR